MANTLRFKRGLVAGIPNGALGEPLFTTDTFDLYIGNGTGNTRFQKYIASGATTQILRGDGSLYTFPLNISSPSNGQVLKYDGTNWVNSADAGVTGSGTAGQVTYWGSSSTITGSNNLFWDATNNRLGIGTNSPTRALQVQGTGFFADNLQVQKDFIGSTTIRVGNLGTIDATTLMQFALSEDGATVNGYFRRYRNGTGLTEIGFSNALTFMGAVTGTPAERMRIFANGNISINSATDNGLRFQVTGDASVNGNTASYIAQLNQANTTAGASFGVIIRGGTNVSDSALRVQNAATTLNLLTVQGNGSLGLGTTLLTGYNVRINKTITGSSVAYGIDIDSAIQSDVTNSAVIYGTNVGTQATAFTLGSLYHFNATQGTFGAGSAVTSQFGFRVSSNMVGATTNYGFYGDIASGTGRWNLYMNGSAANFLSGNLGVGTNSISARLHVSSTSSGDGIRVSNTGTATIRLFNNSQTTGSFELGQGFASGTDNVAYVWNGSNAAMVFGTNATERMRLDASGNLGLGVTPSATSGTYKNVQNGLATMMGSTSDASAYWNANATFNSGWKYIANGTSTRYEQGTGHIWFIAPSGTAGNAISYTQAMTLHSTGNLAVGTGSSADAGFRLDVNGTMRVSGASTLIGSNTTVGTFALEVLNSASTILLRARNDGSFSVNGGVYSNLGSTSTNGFTACNSDSTLTSLSSSDIAVRFTDQRNAANAGYSYWFATLQYSNLTYTSGTGGFVNISRGYAPTSGTGSFNSMILQNVINQTGGANGITRGLYVNPTLTAAADWRSVETSNNSGWAFYAAGTAPSFFGGAATFSSSVTSASLNVNSGGAYISGFRGGLSSPNAGQLYYGADNTGWQFSIGKLVSSTYTAQMVFKDNSTVTTTSDFIIAGGYGLDFINGSGNTVTAMRSTAGGTSIMSSTSTGTHIAVGTEAASDLILASNNTERIRLSSNGFFSQINATNPSASITDSYIQYSADVTAGNAAPHFRTENGAVIKLYQETTGVGNAIFSQGGGNSVLDDSTFDGYTLRQIVKALRNQGILA